MITVQQNLPFEAVLFTSQAGLAGSLGVTLLDPPSTVLRPRSTAITPAIPGNIYVASLTAPAAPVDPSQLYLIVWDGPGVNAVEELRVTEGPAPSQAVGLVPDVADVGALLRYRTKDFSGNELGTFTTVTRPTGANVERLIAMSVEEVANNCQITAGQIPIVLRRQGRTLAALGAAMLIELSYPEQIASDRSAYDRLERRYNAGLTRFCAAVETALAVDPVLGGTVDNLLPLYSFPPDELYRAPGTETRVDWRDPSVNRRSYYS